MTSAGKMCLICKEIVELNNFHKNSNRKDGLAANCKECAKSISREWYSNNRERGIANAKRRKEKHRYDHQERLYNAAKDRSTGNGKAFDITKEDVIIVDTCPVLGIPLSYTGGKASASSYSLDRIDSSKGYVKGNVQVISRKANAMKNNASKEELIAFAKWVMKTFEETN